jgi:hypothetical protein
MAKTERKRLDKNRADIFDVPAGIWTSNDNGQIACEIACRTTAASRGAG